VTVPGLTTGRRLGKAAGPGPTQTIGSKRKRAKMSFLQKQFGFSSGGFRRPEYDKMDTINLLWTPRMHKDPLQPKVSSVEPELQLEMEEPTKTLKVFLIANN
jgi:hypothetical protein